MSREHWTLDQHVAFEIMGMTVFQVDRCDLRYSSDIQSTEYLLEKLKESAFVTIESFEQKWRVVVSCPRAIGLSIGSTIPETVCEAALSYVRDLESTLDHGPR